MKHPVEPGTIWFFLDETFVRTSYLPNNNLLAYDSHNVPLVIRTKFLKIETVFGCVSSESEDQAGGGFRLNSNGYVELLDTIVKPWMVASGRPYMWQQDSVPCWENSVENFYNFIGPNVWPPYPPVCNPMDYYVLGAVEKTITALPVTQSPSWLTGPRRHLEFSLGRTIKLHATDSEDGLRLWWTLRVAFLNKISVDTFNFYVPFLPLTRNRQI